MCVFALLHRQDIFRFEILGISALSITTTDNIPHDTTRAIDGDATRADRKELSRLWVIFSTMMTREHPSVIQVAGRSGN